MTLTAYTNQFVLFVFIPAIENHLGKLVKMCWSRSTNFTRQDRYIEHKATLTTSRVASKSDQQSKHIPGRATQPTQVQQLWKQRTSQRYSVPYARLGMWHPLETLLIHILSARGGQSVSKHKGNTSPIYREWSLLWNHKWLHHCTPLISVTICSSIFFI